MRTGEAGVMKPFAVMLAFILAALLASPPAPGHSQRPGPARAAKTPPALGKPYRPLSPDEVSQVRESLGLLRPGMSRQAVFQTLAKHQPAHVWTKAPYQGDRIEVYQLGRGFNITLTFGRAGDFKEARIVPWTRTRNTGTSRAARSRPAKGKPHSTLTPAEVSQVRDAVARLRPGMTRSVVLNTLGFSRFKNPPTLDWSKGGEDERIEIFSLGHGYNLGLTFHRGSFAKAELIPWRRASGL
jgi:hypothetical protein